NYGVDGARKVHAQLRREGTAVARCTVERLMRQMGLQGLRRGKRPRTTISDNQGPGVGDLVGRTFRAKAPNCLWVADITCIRTFSGWVYRDGCMPHSCSMSSLAGSSAGKYLPRCTPTWRSMPWKWESGRGSEPAKISLA